jgi:hypothetical protein
MPVAVVVLGASIVAGCSVAIASASCCAGIAGIAKRSDADATAATVAAAAELVEASLPSLPTHASLPSPSFSSAPSSGRAARGILAARPRARHRGAVPRRDGATRVTGARIPAVIAHVPSSSV